MTDPEEQDSDASKTAHRHVAEVRERTATLEAQTEAMRNDIKSLDEKQDEVLDRLRNLDNAGVDPDEFESMSEDVEKNTKVRYVLQLLGALSIAVSSGAVVAFL